MNVHIEFCWRPAHTILGPSPAGVWIQNWVQVLRAGYNGQTNVTLPETQNHCNPYPLESYTGRPGTLGPWAVIFHTGQAFYYDKFEMV